MHAPGRRVIDRHEGCSPEAHDHQHRRHHQQQRDDPFGRAGSHGRVHPGPGVGRDPRYLIVHGVHRFRDLRREEDDYGYGRRGAEREPTPSEQFLTLLREGPPLGIHLLFWCDTLPNLNRSLDRPAVRECAMRVLFQMSAGDSSTLIDSPVAARLGRHRALFYHEELGLIEKFRPYDLPPRAWLAGVRDRLAEKQRS